MQYKKKISVPTAAGIFGIATVYFYLLLFTLFPFLKSNFHFNPSLNWFITGYFLFIPLFLYAILMTKREGRKSRKEVFEGLAIKQMSKEDWQVAILGTILAFIFSGVIFGGATLLNKEFGVRMLNTTPWFMDEMQPYQGIEKLYLLIWLTMFFFNIVGEEILWRGYIQNRMEGKWSWLVCAILWTVFHLPFGFDIIVMAAPVLLIIPHIFAKRQNTTIGIFIHAVYNGPIFILIALGFMS